MIRIANPLHTRYFSFGCLKDDIITVIHTMTKHPLLERLVKSVKSVLRCKKNRVRTCRFAKKKPSDVNAVSLELVNHVGGANCITEEMSRFRVNAKEDFHPINKQG